MGDRVGKGLQFPVGDLQLQGSLLDALLQFQVELDVFQQRAGNDAKGLRPLGLPPGQAN